MPFQFRKEAIEEDLNSNFPSQGQGNPPLYYSLSEVVVPTYSINQAAEGTNLAENLQTAWDFSTGFNTLTGAASTTIINTPGFWKIDWFYTAAINNTNQLNLEIDDGVTQKSIWRANTQIGSVNAGEFADEVSQIIFLRSGDQLDCVRTGTTYVWNIWYRQIADVNGNLVNPLGFSFA